MSTAPREKPAVALAALLALLAGLPGLTGCRAEAPPAVGQLRRSLAAICSVTVKGFGLKEVETDYVPHVVNCENGDAEGEALKAQAVVSRSYLHYVLNKVGGNTVGSGTSVQVYSCPRDKLLAQKHLDAAKATAGQILMYQGKHFWPCFIAGTKATPPCTPTTGCCTNNLGKSGSAVDPGPCGDDDDRGCFCQLTANCLSGAGKSYEEIIRFAYGDDVEFVDTTGTCVTPTEGGPPLPTDGGAMDRGADRTGSDDQGLRPVPPSEIGLPVEEDRDSAAASPVAFASDPPGLNGGCRTVPGSSRGGEIFWLLLAAFGLPRFRRPRA